MDDLEFKKRVGWAINRISEDRRLGNIEIAQLLNSSPTTVSNYRTAKNAAKTAFIISFCKEFKYNKEWFDFGKGEPFPGAREKYPEVCGPADLNGLREIISEFNSEKYVFIKQINGNISAGGGLSPDNSSDMLLAFRKEWLIRKGDPYNMSLIRISGDSMEPTLLSGDIVLVDHSRKSIESNGGIYAISIDHEILIKRLHILYQDSKINVISDNKQYPPQEIDSDKIFINGKVIWYARELER